MIMYLALRNDLNIIGTVWYDVTTGRGAFTWECVSYHTFARSYTVAYNMVKPRRMRGSEDRRCNSAEKKLSLIIEAIMGTSSISRTVRFLFVPILYLVGKLQTIAVPTPISALFSDQAPGVHNTRGESE